LPWFGIVVLSTFVLAGVFGPWMAPYPPNKINLGQSLLPPFFAGGNAEHLLGTDQLGRDVLSRLLSGAQVSLLVAVGAVMLAGVLGTSVALVAGYLGGRLDTILTRITDASMAFPVLLLGIVIVALYGTGISVVILVIVLGAWPQYARVLRSEVIRVRGQAYVTMATVLGGGARWSMLRHVLPNIVPTFLVLATLQVGLSIVAEGSMSFLGIGVPLPDASWGNMLADGRAFMRTAWWLAVLPGVALSLTVVAANVVGDWLRHFLDPSTRTGR
jgi:peptide/nickel transport system permease protein